MNDLHHRAEPDRGRAAVADELRGEQQQGRPQALTAARVQIAADGGDGVDGGNRFEGDLFFYAPEIVLDEIEDLLRRERLP